MDNSKYIIRNGELELVWQYKIVQNFFNTYLYCRGTESEVREYIEGEFPHEKGTHRALSENEVDMINKLHLTIYIAPKLKNRR